MVPPRSGYRTLAQQVTSGELLVQDFKIIVCLFGRADIIDRSVRVTDGVMQFGDAVKARNPACVMLLLTPLPWPGDAAPIARKLFRTTSVLKALCHGNTNMDFLRASQHFVQLEGVNESYVQGRGLTLAGQRLLVKLIRAKIDCGQLRARYAQLAQLCAQVVIN